MGIGAVGAILGNHWMIISNAWRVHGYEEEDTLEGDLLDVRNCTTALEQFGVVEATFYSDMSLPHIELALAHLAVPADVIRIGRLLEAELALPVYLNWLAPHHIDFLVDGTFLVPRGREYTQRGFEDAKVSWDELEHAWAPPR